MVKCFESSDWTTGYSITSINREKVKIKIVHFLHHVCLMISGLARRRRPANRAGQRPSDWGAIRRRPPKTLSRCRGSFPRLLILTERWKQRLTQHAAVLQQIKVCWRGPVGASENFLFIPSSSLFPSSLSSLCSSSPQQLFGGNVRRLHLPLSVGEPARVSALHQEQLQGDRQWVHPGDTGSDAELPATGPARKHTQTEAI